MAVKTRKKYRIRPNSPADKFIETMKSVAVVGLLVGLVVFAGLMTSSDLGLL